MGDDEFDEFGGYDDSDRLSDMIDSFDVEEEMAKLLPGSLVEPEFADVVPLHTSHAKSGSVASASAGKENMEDSAGGLDGTDVAAVKETSGRLNSQEWLDEFQ